MQIEPRLWRRGLAVLALSPLAVLAPATAHAQDEEVFDSPKDAAASWLAEQAEGDYWMNGGQPSEGTTLDAAIGFMAAGVGGDRVEGSLQWFSDKDVLDGYLFSGEDGDDMNAGSAGKLVYAIETSGGDSSQFAERDLKKDLADTKADGGLYGTTDSSLATAWAVLGLDRAGEEIDEETGTALAGIQCEDGSFSWQGGPDCAGTPDITGTVVSALTVIGGDDAAAAKEKAVQWLLDNQAEDGSYNADGSEDTAGDANSTAVAAQALLQGEHREEAEKAVSFLLTLQLGCGEDGEGAVKYQAEENEEFGEEPRVLATAQSLVPLSGQNYVDLDASAMESGIPDVECRADGGTEESEAAEKTATWLPWAITGAIVVIGAVIAFAVVRSKRHHAEK
ncbi:prenyltransferase/squalene oxidase repeat-containing protein [Salininema proteolyticum]|uniref:Prenyltransferase/squalene oxidase repeat-containing protein n=1 Tax=Salininema proteolyticum TaxID=1607685 RepID=A0ABV8TU45_9ACTN